MVRMKCFFGYVVKDTRSLLFRRILCPGKGRLRNLNQKQSIGIEHLVDGFFCSDGGDKDGKAKVIRDIVVDFGLDKAQTYTVGDSYYYDYEAGKKASVNSFLLEMVTVNNPFLFLMMFAPLIV